MRTGEGGKRHSASPCNHIMWCRDDILNSEGTPPVVVLSHHPSIIAYRHYLLSVSEAQEWLNAFTAIIIASYRVSGWITPPPLLLSQQNEQDSLLFLFFFLIPLLSFLSSPRASSFFSFLLPSPKLQLEGPIGYMLYATGPVQPQLSGGAG